jgi:TolA-binding protein
VSLRVRGTAPHVAAFGLTLAGVLFARGPAQAAPDKSADKKAAELMSAQPTPVKAAAERTIEGSSAKLRPTGTSAARGSAGRPAMKGPPIPEELRKQIEAQMAARVERNVKQIRGLRDEAIKLLTTFVNETPKEAREMPEALMRLGELKWEVEREVFVQRFETWEKKPQDQRGPAPEPNYAVARDLFARVLRDYPWYPEYDLALYADGFMATEQGKSDEALERFTRILKEYPQSRFVPDAHMARAEHFFTNKYDYQGALAEYEEVLKYKQSDLYGLALFKSAWCLWRLNRSDEAVVRFVEVFKISDRTAAANGKKLSGAQQKQLDELQGEALKYLVEVFTQDEKNTANDMYKFLVKINGDKFAGRIVKALAETFYDQAHHERGIEAYELVIKLDPTSREAGDWAMQIAAGYEALEDYKGLRSSYERLIAGYTQGGTWARTQADSGLIEAQTKKVEEQIRKSALAIHAKAQRDKTSRVEFDAAASTYEVYLSRFKDQREAYDMMYNLADIQFQRLEKNSEAASNYLASARAMPEDIAAKEPGKTLRHDALYNALSALERVRVVEIEARKKKPNEAFTETETDRKFAEALELYAQLYPEDPALSRLFFRQGRLYYDNGVYDPAVRIFGSLLEKFPRSEEALPAGQLILESFNKSKNYDNIETWARRLKAAPAFQSAESQQKLETLIVQAAFKQGEAKSEAGDHAGAAKAYLRAARDFPKDARAAQACVNAALSAKKAGDLATLKEAAQLATSKDYRDRAESPQSAWIAASTFQSMGLFSDAADMHESIANLADREHPNFLKFEHSKDAAYNAVLLRTTVGEHDKAIQNGNKFVSTYGGTSEADEVYFYMGRAHVNAGRNKEAAELFRRFIPRTRSADKRAQAFVQLAMVETKQGNPKGADEALRAAVLLGKRSGRDLGPDGKYAAARARYMEGERVLARFDEIQIQGDVKQLAQRLRQKAELLKGAATIFLDTVSMGVAEWSTAALFQIGRTYESFAKALHDAPPPPGLSDADKEAYQQQIDDFVVPIEERALDAYENGWKKAVELGIYNQWTAKMREALGRLNSELYPPFKETGFEVRSQAVTTLPALIEAPRRGVAKEKDKEKDAAKPSPLQPEAPKPKAGGKK